MMNDNRASIAQDSAKILLLWLFLLFTSLYLLPLDTRPLIIPDETRYAEIPYEMLLSGDWVTPRLDGLRYFEKPPLGYWLNAIALKTFGANNFALRISSALAAGLTIFLVYRFSLRFYRRRATAALSAFIYLSFLLVYLLGTYNTLDSLLTLLLTGGIMSYVLATLETRPHKAWWYWTGSGMALGLAFLAKGFLALAVPVLVLVPWLIWQRQWRALLIKGWWVILIATLVVLPWGLMIHHAEGDFWHYFFWIEHIKRFTSDHAQHKAPFYYFLLYFPLLSFPWFSLLPAAVNGLKQSAHEKPAIDRLLWLWLLLPFIFFSLSSGKLATYILPCFPALALLTANGLMAYLQNNEQRRYFKWGIRLNLLIVVMASLVLIGLQIQGGDKAVYSPQEWPSLIWLLLSLLIALIAGIAALRSSDLKLQLFGSMVFLLPVAMLVTIAIPDKSLQRKSPQPLIEQAAGLIDDNTRVISSGSMLRAVNWYLKRQDVYLLDANELRYGLSYPDASRRLLDASAFEHMLMQAPQHPLAVFCHKSCPQDIAALIPDNAFSLHYGAFDFYLVQ